MVAILYKCNFEYKKHIVQTVVRKHFDTGLMTLNFTFSFDCPKNQPLPKLPDQSTYYSRQFYIYNLTIVQGTSKDKLTKENVFSYVWGEEQYSIALHKIRIQ